MNDYKSLNKYLNKKSEKNNNNATINTFIRNFISKVLISLIIFILFLIGNKISINFKSSFYDKVYGTTFSFATINNWYKNNFGDIFPIENILPNAVEVFSEKLSYESANVYKDGVALKVSNQYLVPLLNNGIVIYIGEKEGYGKTLIVQEESGIDVWYSNINFSDVELYDYVKKGSFIGEADGDTIYLLFQKEGEFLDYKDYI